MIDNNITFRNLRADEIMIRPTDTKYKGSALLLLYKDARCDMSILDETVGPFNWSKDYKEIKGNVYCGVCINGVWKWDCGAESSTEKEKGEASDSFKRACVNWGLGRELYTGPKIKIKCPDSYYFNDKMCMTFSVKEIGYDGKKITNLVIVDRFDNVVFDWKEGKGTVPVRPVKVQPAKITKVSVPLGTDGRLSRQLYAQIMNAGSQDNLMEIYNLYPELKNTDIFLKTLGKRKEVLLAS